MRLKDKVAVVTGAASGIGEEIASRVPVPGLSSPISISAVPIGSPRNSIAMAERPSPWQWT